jgi:hypothetical protein
VKQDADFLGGATFQNVYTINAATGAAALIEAGVIRENERAIFSIHTHFIETRVSVPHVHTATHLERHDLLGLRTPLGDLLPGWNVARVDFADVAGGRPERKYLRVGLGTGDVVGQVLTSAMISTITTNYTLILAANTAYVGPTGENHDAAGGVTFPEVQMRQLHWSRRHRPGFHRGYVPNA